MKTIINCFGIDFVGMDLIQQVLYVFGMVLIVCMVLAIIYLSWFLINCLIWNMKIRMKSNRIKRLTKDNVYF